MEAPAEDKKVDIDVTGLRKEYCQTVLEREVSLDHLGTGR